MRSIYRSAAAHDRVRDWRERRLDAWQVPHTRSYAGHLVLDEAVDRVAPVVSEALGAR
ncbi:hypothetical protein ACGFZH_20535 [Streptomyces zaomyceticus]|uniref:hypothetical protein n=1 Tax=Streptomyces TaxID=1883 RepID=UPI0037178B11